MTVTLVKRFGLTPAPGGLQLVQDLLNTSLSGHQGDPERDYLADLDTARSWLAQALEAWAGATGQPLPEISLRKADLAPLSDVREQLRASIRAHAAHIEPTEAAVPDQVDVTVELTISSTGKTYGPTDPGWSGVAALVAMELLLAQAAGTSTRLKACAAPACGACFYDASPNRARAWHDTKMCGNAPNLRASRARRSGH
jgi:predicted RNA-binding Zn ribbon-like protein